MDTSKMEDRVREIRKEFFAFRNGIVADKLRKAGDPHPMIMGCLLADIKAIAERTRQDAADKAHLAAIAQELWDDANSRECRLAAPMLYPPELMGLELALVWSQSVECTEVADILCHGLLRHITEADALFRQLIADERPLVKYAGYRLLLNLLLTGKVQPGGSLRAIVENESSQAQAPLAGLLKDVLEELD